MIPTGITRFFPLLFLILGLLGCPASPPAGIPAPVSELLSVGAPDSSGRVFLSGAPGAVLPGAEVIATNVTETSSNLFRGIFISVAQAGVNVPFVNNTVAGPDGSFSLFLGADFGDVIEVVQMLEGETSDPTGLVVTGETIFLGVPLQDLAVNPLGGSVHVTGNDGAMGILFDLNFGESPLLSLPAPLCDNFENGITRLALDAVTSSAYVIAPGLNALFTLSLEEGCQPLKIDVPHSPRDVTADPVSGGVLVGVEAGCCGPNIFSFNQDGPTTSCNVEILHPEGQGHVATTLLATGPLSSVFAVSEFADGSTWATRVIAKSPCPARQAAGIPLPAGTQASGLAALDDQSAMISDDNGNQVFIADFENNLIIDQIPVGAGPRGIAVDASNHHRAYVVGMENNTLSVIDLMDFSVQDISSVGLMPTEIVLLPGGNQAVVLSTSDQSVVLLGLNF